jgi:hypothetical protein
VSVDIGTLPTEIYEHYAAMPWQKLDSAELTPTTIEIVSSAGHGFGKGRRVRETWTLFKPVLGHLEGFYVMTNRHAVVK